MSYNQSMKSKQFLKLLKAAHAEIIRNRGKGGHYLVKLNGKSTRCRCTATLTMTLLFLMIFANNSVPD